MMPVLSVHSWDILPMVIQCMQLWSLLVFIHDVHLGAIGPATVYHYSGTPQHNIIDLNCTGSEDTILDCPHNATNGYYCSLSHDANVFCEGKEFIMFKGANYLL